MVSLGWKLIMPLCPDKHQLTTNSKKKKNKDSPVNQFEDEFKEQKQAGNKLFL